MEYHLKLSLSGHKLDLDVKKGMSGRPWNWCPRRWWCGSLLWSAKAASTSQMSGLIYNIAAQTLYGGQCSFSSGLYCHLVVIKRTEYHYKKVNAKH